MEGTGCVLDRMADDIDDSVVGDRRGIGQGEGGPAELGCLEEGHFIGHIGLKKVVCDWFSGYG